MKKTKRAIIATTGFVFVILGILGLILPFLQGILFIIIGVFLLSFLSPALRSWIDKNTIKYPTIHTKIKKVEEKIKTIFGEI